jgi:hypothetical protein
MAWPIANPAGFALDSGQEKKAVNDRTARQSGHPAPAIQGNA